MSRKDRKRSAEKRIEYFQYLMLATLDAVGEKYGKQHINAITLNEVTRKLKEESPQESSLIETAETRVTNELLTSINNNKF